MAVFSYTCCYRACPVRDCLNLECLYSPLNDFHTKARASKSLARLFTLLPLVLRVYLYCHTRFSKEIWQSPHSHTQVHNGRNPHTHQIKACCRPVGVTFTSLSVPRLKNLSSYLKTVNGSHLMHPMGAILKPLYTSLSVLTFVTLLHLLLLYLSVKKWKWPYFVLHSGYRSWTKAQAERRQQNIPCVAGPKSVSAGHDQQHSEWRRRPLWDV